MAKLGTYCNECVFYENDHKLCTLGKLDKFKGSGAEILWELDGPKVDRVCMYRRPFSWLNGKTIQECSLQVKEEVYLSGTILLLVDHLEDLPTSIDVLSRVKNIDRFKIIMSHPESVSMDEVKKIADKIDFAESLCMLSFISEEEKRIFACFKKSRNGVFVILDCSKSFREDILDRINNVINEEMIRVAHIQPVDGYHRSVTSTVMYNHLYGDIQKSIADKLIESEASNLIMTWEAVDEKYSN